MKKITLVKSTIACLPNQITTAKSLGLRKVGDSIVLDDTPATQGKIRVLSHLVKVEDVDDAAKNA